MKTTLAVLAIAFSLQCQADSISSGPTPTGRLGTEPTSTEKVGTTTPTTGTMPTGPAPTSGSMPKPRQEEEAPDLEYDRILCQMTLRDRVLCNLR